MSSKAKRFSYSMDENKNRAFIIFNMSSKQMVDIEKKVW